MLHPTYSLKSRVEALVEDVREQVAADPALRRDAVAALKAHAVVVEEHNRIVRLLKDIAVANECDAEGVPLHVNEHGSVSYNGKRIDYLRKVGR